MLFPPRISRMITDRKKGHMIIEAVRDDHLEPMIPSERETKSAHDQARAEWEHSSLRPDPAVV